MVWTPRVTVAAVIEKENKFLIVEEMDNGKAVFNQPAGHLEEDETLIEAVIRETAEETCTVLSPSSLTGIYQWKNPLNSLTFLRFCFTGTLSDINSCLNRDPDITDVHWLSFDDLKQRPMRSPLVLRSIEDYLGGKRIGLEVLASLRY